MMVIGVVTRESYMPCYLVGYQMALDAVEKLRRCGARRVFMSHVGILEEERLCIMREKYHAVVKQEEQPDFAFNLNAAATLKLVERECMGGQQ